MPKIRILVVDDSAVIRRLLSEELSKDPLLEVAGTAANGKIALSRLPQVNPDLVVLDIEMPEMDGLETLRELRKTYRKLPVIMFSSLTERGATATLDALALGATDYFTKPISSGLDASLEVIRMQLIPKIKALGIPAKTAESVPAASMPCAAAAIAPRPAARVEILAVGASTGGPNALAEIFPRLPAGFPVPIVIVQHMPPMFTKLLAERLSAQSSIQVHEGASGAVLEAGHAYIAPGDYHMVVVRDGAQKRVLIQQDPPENSCRPAVDPLFRSVAQAYGAGTLAVVLTGMGQDGLRGCQVLREVGAQIVAQDEATSVVWGMPGAVVRAGLAHRVLPLPLIALEINQRVRAPQIVGRAASLSSRPGECSMRDWLAARPTGCLMTSRDFEFVCKVLRERSAIVLEPGKEYLVENRLAPIVRRLELASITDLVARLQAPDSNGLIVQIVEALVTTETTFFRDVHPFESLKKTVLPDLISRRAGERALTIWCAASSTGQEPYSLAMLLREHFPQLRTWNVFLLATDLSREMLGRARTGLYNQIEVNRGLPAPLLIKYFQQQGTHWQLKQEIRDLVEFREMNLAQPWPFLPRMDLILNRNVMIYFDAETKKSILSRMARLLRPDGYLLLGGSETTYNLNDSFQRVEPLKAGFYRLVGAPT